MNKRKITAMVGAVSLALSSASFAAHHDDDHISVVMKDLKTESSMGTVKVSDYDDDGVVFTPNLKSDEIKRRQGAPPLQTTLTQARVHKQVSDICYIL